MVERIETGIESNRYLDEAGCPLQYVGELLEEPFVTEFGAGCRSIHRFRWNGRCVDIVGPCKQIKEGHENLQVIS